jgi:hypothetical protein
MGVVAGASAAGFSLDSRIRAGVERKTAGNSRLSRSVGAGGRRSCLGRPWGSRGWLALLQWWSLGLLGLVGLVVSKREKEKKNREQGGWVYRTRRSCSGKVLISSTVTAWSRGSSPQAPGGRPEGRCRLMSGGLLGGVLVCAWEFSGFY